VVASLLLSLSTPNWALLALAIVTEPTCSTGTFAVLLLADALSIALLFTILLLRYAVGLVTVSATVFRVALALLLGACPAQAVEEPELQHESSRFGCEQLAALLLDIKLRQRHVFAHSPEHHVLIRPRRQRNRIVAILASFLRRDTERSSTAQRKRCELWVLNRLYSEEGVVHNNEPLPRCMCWLQRVAERLGAICLLA
jgi:hypothetical protein